MSQLTDRKRTLKQNAKLAAWAIGISAIPYGYALLRYNLHNWTPLNAPVRLTPGTDSLPPFKTDLTGTFQVWIDFEGVTSDQQDCEMGRVFPSTCNTISQTLALSWLLLTDGKIVQGPLAYRPNSTGASYHRMSMQLGAFDSRRGEHYTIQLIIGKDAGDLNSLDPHIRVEATDGYWEKWLIYMQAGILLTSFVTGACGLGLLLNLIHR